MKNKKYTYLSLFSGIGGIDAGLHSAGFHPLFCCELDPNASNSLKGFLHQKGLSPKFEYDINNVSPLKLMKDLGIKAGEIDLLAGGPPCQAFSLIGKRKSLDDDRGMLLFKMAEFASIFQPKVILIEQVKGLLSASCEDNIKGGAFAKLISKLESLGYIVNHKTLTAADYGVPQLRERVFIIASKHKEFRFPQPTHFPESKAGLFLKSSSYKTVRDAIGDLPSPATLGEPETIPNHYDITPARDIERINGVPEGECLSKQLHLPKSQRMNLTEKDTTKFRRIAWNLPSLTLRGGEAFYHPTDNRYLTPREYLRIHGFDDTFVLHGPIKGRSGTFKALDQHRQVANAVPPKLAEILGKEVIEQFLKQPGTLPKPKVLPRQQDYAEALLSAGAI